MRTAAGILGASILLAGCGSSSAAPKPNDEASKTAVQVFNDAERAVGRASSVHALGTIRLSQTKRTSIDIASVTNKGGTASVATGDVRFKVVLIGDEVYIRGNKAFSGSAATTLAGKWLKCSADSVMGQKAALTSTFFLLRPVSPGGGLKLKNKGAKTYKGEKAVEIHASSGGKLYVAATGPPYPLALVAHSEVITFDDFNAPVSLTAPKNAIVRSKFCGKL